MAPVLGRLPKVLAPVDGRPFLSLVLDRWARLGCERVHLLLGHGAADVWACAVSANRPGLAVSASIEPQPLGVIGALRFARSCLADRFIFTYGDVYPTVPPDALLARLAPEDEGCVAACPVDLAGERATVVGERGRVTYYGKNETGLSHVDVGAIVLRASVLDALPVGVSLHEKDLLRPLAESGKLAMYEHRMPSRHIGDPAAYDAFAAWFRSHGTLAGTSRPRSGVCG